MLQKPRVHFVSTLYLYCLLFGTISVLAHPSAQCTHSIDPPTLYRNGGDYLTEPLSTNATITDCINICCKDTNCVSFSFNKPQPQNTCIGPKCCVKGGVCCLLKNKVPPEEKNTYGPAVTTGLVSYPGPTPPLERSTAITGVTFGNISWWNGNGDTWPTTWAEDGTVYGWCCDSNIKGTATPMSVWTLSGDPYSNTLIPSLAAVQPIDYMKLCAQYGHPSQRDLNVKPGTVIALNQSIYTSVSCMNYGDNPKWNRQHNLGGFLARSDDAGKTWRNVTEVGAFSGRFSAPIFVNCGKNNAPCRALFPFLYVFFQGGVDNNAYWCNNDAMYLARVREAEIENLAAYEYYVGTDDDGMALWVADQDEAQFVMVYGRMIGENAISYNPEIGRFLMANYGFIDKLGQPRPFHQQPMMEPHRTQLLLLESPTPWGPWRYFYRDDDSASAPGMYTPTFPTAYMRPKKGNELEVIMFFSCLGQAPNCRYTLNWQPVTFHLA